MLVYQRVWLTHHQPQFWIINHKGGSINYDYSYNYTELLHWLVVYIPL